MFKILPESHDDLLVVKANEKLTVDDYDKIIIPKLNEMFKKYDKIRAMIIFDENFSGWNSLNAVWDDAKIGMDYPNNFSKIALMAAPSWMDWGVMIFGFFAKGDFRFFPCSEKKKAMAWLEE